MSIETRFIEPLDVLFIRGNKLFGDSGSYGEALVPPWPSVAAGALRSRLLADDGVDLVAFAHGKINHPTLGTPTSPGDFSVVAFHLARRYLDGRIEIMVSAPADLIISEIDDKTTISRLQPTAVVKGLQASNALTMLPVLAQAKRSKPSSGYWLTQAAWEQYLNGQTPAVDVLIKTNQLWTIDHRVGVGIDSQTQRAAEGKLFSMQAVSMLQRQHSVAGFDVGFIVSVSGAKLPKSGSVRLGGDGRAAALLDCSLNLPMSDYNAIVKARRCRIILTTPGIFSDGWRLPGVGANSHFALRGVRGKLICAAVPRAEVISGWDLARHQPKPAQRVAPTGSVYWLDELDTSSDALDKLVATGLWDETCDDVARRAEGFNRFTLATY